MFELFFCNIAFYISGNKLYIGLPRMQMNLMSTVREPGKEGGLVEGKRLEYVEAGVDHVGGGELTFSQACV